MGTIAENNLIAFSKETVYGTYVDTAQTAIAATVIKPKLDASLIARDDDKVGSIFGLVPIPGRKKVSLNVSSKVYPGNEIGLILWQMLGSSTASGSASAYTNVFALVESMIGVKSLSSEIVEGGLTADDYSGIMFNTLTIKGGNDGYVTMDLVGAAQARVAGTVMTPIVITTAKPYRFFNAVVSYAGAQTKVDSWEVSLDLSLLLENFKQAQTIEQPVLNGRPKVTAKFERFLVDRTQRASYEAGTAAQFKVALTHSDNIPTTSTPYALSFELPVAVIEGYDVSGDAGKLKESISLVGYVGTSEGANTTSFEAKVVNSVASYT